MGYSIHEHRVRLDVFKSGGKWRSSHELNMQGHYDTTMITEAIAKSVIRDKIHVPEDWYIVVLEPYHRHAHPIMMTGKRIKEYE